MWSRIAFGLVAVFFVTMNVLLWRSEVIGRKALSVPARVVWKRVLENEHKTSFEIRHQGLKVGYCRLAITIEGEHEPAEVTGAEPPAVEGMIGRQSGYTIDFDGSIQADTANRVRFYSALKLDAAESWRDFSLRVNMRPDNLEVIASAAAQNVKFNVEDEQGRRDRVFTFDQLRRPEKLLQELGVPVLGDLLAITGLPFPAAGQNAITMNWVAWTDSYRLGNIPIPVYRLQLIVLDRPQVQFWVRRDSGEILRIELPGGLILINDLLTQF